MISYKESDMDFSPLFKEGMNTVYIEKSKFYKKFEPHGVKTVEFWHLRQSSKSPQLCFIEAKVSAPDIANPKSHQDYVYCQDCPNKPESKSSTFCDECPKNTINIYCSKIYAKMQHSLELYVSKLLGIGEDKYNEFPAIFTKTRLSSCSIRFILVIKKHDARKDKGGLKAAIQRKLLPLRKIWNADVTVMGEAEARTHGYIL